MVLPVLLVLVLGVVQVGRVVGAQVAVVEAARAAARAASVDPRAGVADAAARRAVPALAECLDVHATVADGPPRLVTATASCRVAPLTDLPGLRSVTVTVHATETMAVERPPGG